VKWDAVTSLEATQPLHLTLKDGRTVVGTVTTAEGALDVTRKRGRSESAEESVAIIRNDAEQTAYDAESTGRSIQSS